MKTLLKQFIIFLTIVSPMAISALLFVSLANNWWGREDFIFQGAVIALAAGMLGGAVYTARGFYQSVAGTPTPFNFEKFFWWYLLRPAVSAIAGLVAATILYLAFDLQESFTNLAAFFLASFIVGYNFHAFIEHRIKKNAEDVLDQ